MSRLGLSKTGWAQLLAYVLIVLAGAYGFYLQEQQNEGRCEASKDTRESQRNVINAVSDFAYDLIERPEGSPPLSAAERVRVELYKQRVTDFRETNLKLVPPVADYCKEYEGVE